MSEELLPCWRCDSKNIDVREYKFSKKKGLFYFCMCIDCNINNGYFIFDKKSSAIKNWNDTCVAIKLDAERYK